MGASVGDSLAGASLAGPGGLPAEAGAPDWPGDGAAPFGLAAGPGPAQAASAAARAMVRAKRAWRMARRVPVISDRAKGRREPDERRFDAEHVADQVVGEDLGGRAVGDEPAVGR